MQIFDDLPELTDAEREVLAESLNEAPLLYLQRRDMVHLVKDWFAPRPICTFVNVITALDAMGLINRSAARDELRDGQPG